MTFIESFLLISIILNIILIYAVYNVFSKYMIVHNTLLNYEDKILNIFIVFKQAYDNIIRIDKNGMFSSDDEVGFSFKILRSNFQDIANLIKDIVNAPEEIK